MKTFTRKSLLLTLFSLSLFVLGACSDNSSSNDNNTKGSGEEVVSLEILSFWTAGGEADALNALLDGFHDENPDIKVENAAIAGGGGANSQAVLSSRLQGGDPPAVFQAQGGMDLLRWEEANYLENIDDIFNDNDWGDVFPEEIVNMNSLDGHIYGVPMNIHRNNVLWYNTKVFDELGIEPPKTFDDLIAVSKELESNGVTPIALGDKNPRWATLWFDVLLLDQLGGDQYAQLWTGELDFDSEGVVNAVENFKELLGYINDNHSSLDWQDATDLIIDDQAAMQLMGDWASGYFESKDWVPNEDYDWIAAPGTSDYFNVVNDSIGYPAGIKESEEAESLLAYMGSEEAQVTFNKLKGSIPARLDADTSDFNMYSQSAAEDFKNLQITISLAGGSPTPAGFLSKVDDAINAFVTQKDTETFIKSLVDAQPLLNK